MIWAKKKQRHRFFGDAFALGIVQF